MVLLVVLRLSQLRSVCVGLETLWSVDAGSVRMVGGVQLGAGGESRNFGEPELGLKWKSRGVGCY